MQYRGCVVTHTPSPSPTPVIFQRQPEPQEPFIWGFISYVPDGLLVSGHIITPDGWESATIYREGSGNWDTLITNVSGVDYIVTADAPVYASQPIIYIVQLGDMKVLLVEDGQITGKEASNLDFYFEQK